MDKQPIIVLSGPTASGKSQLGLLLAQQFNGVIINADAMQIYRQIPIITAQPTRDDLALIHHNLYGVLDISTICSAGYYLEIVTLAIDEVQKNNQIPIIIGGSGLYLKSLIYGIAKMPDIAPDLRQDVRKLYQEIGAEEFFWQVKKHDPAIADSLKYDKQRLIRAYEILLQTAKPISYWQKQQQDQHRLSNMAFLQIALMPHRDKLYQQINARFLQMIENNVIAEIRALNHISLDDDLPARRAHGVRELSSYLLGEISLDEAISKSQQITRNYAKRQITWLNHQMPEMIRLDQHDFSDIMAKCHRLVSIFLDNMKK